MWVQSLAGNHVQLALVSRIMTSRPCNQRASPSLALTLTQHPVLNHQSIPNPMLNLVAPGWRY